MVNNKSSGCVQPSLTYWRLKVSRTVPVVAVAMWCLLVAAQQSSADEISDIFHDAAKQFERLDRKAAQDRESGKTPLHDAAVRGDIAALEAALQSGAPVNQPDATQKTRLYLAAEQGDIRAIELLVKAGARVNTGGGLLYTDGWSPLFGASWNGHVAAIETLLNAGAILTGEELSGAARNGHIPAITALLNEGADVNALSGYAEGTPLHNASGAGQILAIEALLKAGANINATDGLGDTPLHEAAKMGKVAATQALLKSGADVNARSNISGQTPLGAAREWMNVTVGSIIPYQEVIKILQSHGGR